MFPKSNYTKSYASFYASLYALLYIFALGFSLHLALHFVLYFILYFALSFCIIRVFENKFKFDLSNERALRKHLNEDIVKELQSSATIVTGTDVGTRVSSKT